MTDENAPDGIPDDEMLSAWIDGGLDDDGNAKMTHLASTQPETAARAARLRRMDDLVHDAVPLEDNVPAELLARLGLAGAAQPAEVIDLSAVRARKAAPAPRRFALSHGFGRIAAQVALLGGLGIGALLFATRSLQQEADAPYHALGDAASQAQAPANAMIMLAPGTDPGRAAQLAAESGASVVGEPGPTGAVRLSIAPERRDAVLARLRVAPEVTLAEPLDGPTP